MRVEMENIEKITCGEDKNGFDCGGTAVWLKIGAVYCSRCNYCPPVVKYELVTKYGLEGDESVASYANLLDLVVAYNDLNFPPEVKTLGMRLVQGTLTRVLSYKERDNVFWINPAWTEGFEDVR